MKIFVCEIKYFSKLIWEEIEERFCEIFFFLQILPGDKLSDPAVLPQ